MDLKDEAKMKQLTFAFGESLAHSFKEKYADGRMHPRLTTVLINNELAIVGASGEFFSDLANHLKSAVDGPEVLFAGYCNGHDYYFPTRRAFEQGGYGANAVSAWIEPGGPEQMIEKAIANIAALAE